MANNEAIKILRTESITDNNKDITLLEGQPFYNKQKNYLTVGHTDGGTVTQKPITVREVVGYFNDDNGIGNSTTDEYYIKPKKDNKILEINNTNTDEDSGIDIQGKNLNLSSNASKIGFNDDKHTTINITSMDTTSQQYAQISNSVKRAGGSPYNPESTISLTVGNNTNTCKNANIQLYSGSIDDDEPRVKLFSGKDSTYSDIQLCKNNIQLNTANISITGTTSITKNTAASSNGGALKVEGGIKAKNLYISSTEDNTIQGNKIYLKTLYDDNNSLEEEKISLTSEGIDIISKGGDIMLDTDGTLNFTGSGEGIKLNEDTSISADGLNITTHSIKLKEGLLLDKEPTQNTQSSIQYIDFTKRNSYSEGGATINENARLSYIYKNNDGAIIDTFQLSSKLQVKGNISNVSIEQNDQSSIISGWNNIIIKTNNGNNIISGKSNTIESGYNNIISGDSNSIVKASESIISGKSNTITYVSANKYGRNIVSGYINKVNGSESLVIGGNNILGTWNDNGASTDSYSCLISGHYNTVTGNYSAAIGEYLTNKNNDSFICGIYGTANKDALFSVANGTADTESIAFEVLNNGRVNTINTITIDVTSSNTAIETNGNIKANIFQANSDKRLKENIKNFKMRESILSLPIYNFNYIGSDRTTIGCLAQDLQQLYPELVHEDENGYLSIEESKLIYLLIEEVKQLKKELSNNIRK